MSDELCNVCGNSLENMNAQQVGDAIGRGWSGVWNWVNKAVGHKEMVQGLGEVEVVHNGLHPDGEGLAFVWKTRAGFVMMTGYEDSYNDPEWNYDYKFVTPQTKEITVYE